MLKTLITNHQEWRALVAGWLSGVGYSDDYSRTTATYEELEEVLRVEKASLDEFAKRNMSKATVAYAELLSDNAGVRPTSYPVVAVWSFITIPFAEKGEATDHVFVGANLYFVYPTDF